MGARSLRCLLLAFRTAPPSCRVTQYRMMAARIWSEASSTPAASVSCCRVSVGACLTSAARF
eukprot:12913768-Alexandrium_andersonii.AAC.1